MFKQKSYVLLILLVIVLNVFTILAYPNKIYAIKDEEHAISTMENMQVSKAILLTEHLFVNTPKIGEKLDLDAIFGVNKMGSYEVIDYIEDDSGLDAFVLKAPNQQIILSIRGTEGKKFDGDVQIDAKLLLNENQQYENLKRELVIKPYFQDIDYVVGHSLGGSIALNTSLWLNEKGIKLQDVYVFAPAPMIDDEYVNADNIAAINDILSLVVIDNEFLYNLGNEMASNLSVINPYDYFNYTRVSISNDVNSSFANHYISHFIPIVKGENTASYQYYKIH